ncbi:MAG: hypothetical protein ACKVKL_00690 [Pseudomonadales bacterium]|jgi:hypothetical protein|tara:strand:+ start:20234 stop:20614 length:381 start_codon:yes stop_codon:yes gene_type:complete
MEFDIAQYLTELTRYELLESYYLARGALVSDVTIFMTILFAYVTVAYFVSAKMTKFQAITISFLYSFFALYIASAAYNSSFILSKIGLVMSGVDSSSDSLVLVVLFLVTWIFSIILFIQTHRTRDD